MSGRPARRHPAFSAAGAAQGSARLEWWPMYAVAGNGGSIHRNAHSRKRPNRGGTGGWANGVTVGFVAGLSNGHGAQPLQRGAQTLTAALEWGS